MAGRFTSLRANRGGLSESDPAPPSGVGRVTLLTKGTYGVARKILDVTVSAPMSREFADELSAIAADEGVSRSAFIREALKYHVRRYYKKKRGNN